MALIGGGQKRSGGADNRNHRTPKRHRTKGPDSAIALLLLLLLVEEQIPGVNGRPDEQQSALVADIGGGRRKRHETAVGMKRAPLVSGEIYTRSSQYITPSERAGRKRTPSFDADPTTR